MKVTSAFIKSLTECTIEGYVIGNFVREMLVHGNEFEIDYMDIWFLNLEDRNRFLGHLFTIIHKCYNADVVDFTVEKLIYSQNIYRVTGQVEEKKMFFDLIVKKTNFYDDFTIDDVVFELLTGKIIYSPDVSRDLTEENKIEFTEALSSKILYVKPGKKIDLIDRNATMEEFDVYTLPDNSNMLDEFAVKIEELKMEYKKLQDMYKNLTNHTTEKKEISTIDSDFVTM